MKHVSGFLLALVLGSSAAHAALCPEAFLQPDNGRLVDWRVDLTHESQTGSISATSAAREKKIEEAKAWMENFIPNFRGDYGVGDIPPMIFVPAEGVHARYLDRSTGLNGVITRFAVSGLGKEGVIRGTFLLPVSGHQGNANARKWAKTDTYSLKLDTNPKKEASTHHSWGGTGHETFLIKDAKSLDLVTAHEVEIELIKGVPVVVLYDRKGSAGPSGYVEGRVMEFIWDGT